MKVRELVALLQTMPQEIEVAYCCHSDQVLLQAKEIELIKGCPPRPDGWVQSERPDIEPQEYVLFPGN